MALAQIYSAVAGDVITAARWNNEFGNIYNNGTSVAFPVTMAVSFAGFTVTFDAAGVTTVSSTASTGFLFTTGTKVGTPSANGGVATFASSTYTDSGTSASGTAALHTNVSFRTPTLAATNLTVTTTRAATVYIEGAPIASTNETITNPYALLVDSGNVQFDGALNVTGALTAPGGIVGASADPYTLSNIKLVVTMAGSACTIALKTNAGTDPSATDPISVRFRSETQADGGTFNQNITSAQSLTISSGSTLGTVDGKRHRIYVGLVRDAGLDIAELFVYNPLNGTSLIGLSESQLYSTEGEGGVGGRDIAGELVSAISRSVRAIRIIGFFESTQATAGTWSTAVSTIQELQPWMPRTGHVLASVVTQNPTASGDKTTTIALDDTKPQVGEGTQVALVTFTPQNPVNVIKCDAVVTGLVGTSDGAGAAFSIVVALFSSLSADAICCDVPFRVPASGSIDKGMSSFTFRSVDIGTATSFQLRAGASAITGAAVWNYNSSGAATDLAATMGSSLTVSEIMV